MRPLKSTFYFKASEKVQKDNKKATRAAANEAAYAQQQQQQKQPKKCTETKLNQQAAPAYPHPPSGILVKAVRRPTHTHTLVRIESNHKLARPRPAKDFDSFKLGLFPAAAATSSGPWCHINSLVVIVIIIISNIIIVLVVDVDVVVVVYLAFIIASLIAN